MTCSNPWTGLEEGREYSQHQNPATPRSGTNVDSDINQEHHVKPTGIGLSNSLSCRWQDAAADVVRTYRYLAALDGWVGLGFEREALFHGHIT